MTLRDTLEAAGLDVHPPATPAQIAAFEAEHGITLPPSFAAFLRDVGDGIDVDGELALHSLERIAEHGLEGDPRRPFPYSTAEGDAILAAVVASASPLADRAVMSLQKPGPCDGCLTVASESNELSVLIVTGEEAGHVWRAGELDTPETRALYDRGGDTARLDFQAWFAAWAPIFLGVTV